MQYHTIVVIPINLFHMFVMLQPQITMYVIGTLRDSPAQSSAYL